MDKKAGFEFGLRIAYLSVFLLFLLIPLALTNTKKDVVSDFDNRKLDNFPELGGEGFESAVESYLQDRIGLRDYIVTGYQKLNDKVAGELTHPIYTYGQEGYMFFKIHDNIDYGDFHQAFAESVVKMKDYCEDRGVPFYFMFDPEKISVYRRYLPKGVDYNDEWVDVLLTYLNDNGVKVVNNRDLLIEKSYEEQVFNRQYDAGHWNDLGCFYGTNNLWNTVHEDFPEVCEYSFDDFDIKTGVGEYLAASRFAVNEEVPVFEPKYEWRDLSNRYTGIDQNKSFPFFAYYKNKDKKAKNLPKMLVFHGSYYNRGPKFFVGRASEYIGIHDYQNVLELPYYFNIFQPDMVVFEVAEYTFSDTYFSYEKMEGLEFNPLLNSGETISVQAGKIKELVFPESYKLYEIEGKTIDDFYIEGLELSDAHYVYITDGANILDLRKNLYGNYGASVPHNDLKGKISVVYEDNIGDKYAFNLERDKATIYAENEDDITFSDGGQFNAFYEQYELRTNVVGNAFNSVVLQIYDGETGEYLDNIISTAATETVIDSFVHDGKSGWYTLCLKANSNLKDEGINVRAYLRKGERYYYAFTVDELEKDRVVISDFEMLGPGE